MAEKKEDAIIASLSPIEREILPYLHLGSVSKICETAKIDAIKVIRALQFLSNKKLVELQSKTKKQILLGDNGVVYLKHKLPERRLLNLLAEKMTISLDEAKEKANLSENELSVALGVLKKKALIKLINNKISLKASKDEVTKKMLEEKFLEELPIDAKMLKPEQRYALEQLRSRKDIIRIEEKKEVVFSLTKKGKEISALGKSALGKLKLDLIEELTPEMTKTGLWKRKHFREYDITSKVPSVYGGKRQPYYAFLQEVREKLVALGFEEMTGNSIVSEFWNFDALFQPQFHVAREWSATYYVKNKLEGEKLPANIVNKVKKVHEKKWRIKWQLEKAKELILRPQCTVLSALTLASKPKIPGKYFAIARCYRPDVVDAKHLTEFNQVEGIIIQHDLTLRNLFGILDLFAKEIANAKEIRIVPSYFPFTEPSAELQIKHPKLGWLEVGGAGIFRKEVVMPLLGKDITVLAWGLGIDRLAMAKLNILDIRQLFSPDLEFLRSAKV